MGRWCDFLFANPPLPIVSPAGQVAHPLEIQHFVDAPVGLCSVFLFLLNYICIVGFGFD